MTAPHLHLHAALDGYALSFVTPAGREVAARHTTFAEAAEALRAAEAALRLTANFFSTKYLRDVRRV